MNNKIIFKKMINITESVLKDCRLEKKLLIPNMNDINNTIGNEVTQLQSLSIAATDKTYDDLLYLLTDIQKYNNRVGDVIQRTSQMFRDSHYTMKDVQNVNKCNDRILNDLNSVKHYLHHK